MHTRTAVSLLLALAGLLAVALPAPAQFGDAASAQAIEKVVRDTVAAAAAKDGDAFAASLRVPGLIATVDGVPGQSVILNDELLAEVKTGISRDGLPEGAELSGVEVTQVGDVAALAVVRMNWPGGLKGKPSAIALLGKIDGAWKIVALGYGMPTDKATDEQTKAAGETLTKLWNAAKAKDGTAAAALFHVPSAALSTSFGGGQACGVELITQEGLQALKGEIQRQQGPPEGLKVVGAPSTIINNGLAASVLKITSPEMPGELPVLAAILVHSGKAGDPWRIAAIIIPSQG